MSVIHTNNITNKDGTSGPTISGITTVSSTGFMQVPVGDTFKRNVVENVVKDGLVLYLDAGNDVSYAGIGTNVTDLSGTGNNALLYNGVTVSNDAFVLTQSSNQYIIIKHQIPTLNFNSAVGETSFTVMIWANARNASQNSFSGLISQDDPSDSQWAIKKENSELFFRFRRGGASNSLPYPNYTAGKFHCYAATVDTSGVSRIYFDNQFINSTTQAQPGDYNYDVVLGSYRVSNAYTNIFLLDLSYGPVMIYRRALNYDELTQNYNAFRGRYNQ